MKSPVTLLSSLFDDVKRLEPEVKGLDRDLLTIESRFKHEGYGFLSVHLSALCDAFDLGISTGRFTCPTNFSKIRGGAIPRFLQGLLCKVFDSKTGLLLESSHHHIVKCVREILRLFKKVRLSNSRKINLEREAIDGFVETDAFIATFRYDVNRISLLRDVARLTLPNLNGFDSTSLAYRHGPGGVQEKYRPNQKWEGLLKSLSEDDDLAIRLGYDSSIFDGGSLDQDRNSLQVLETIAGYTTLKSSPIEHASCGIARLVTVPKDCTSLRTITVEPVVKQFWQQGLNTLLRDHIKECGILSTCLSLTDQSKNQELAIIGSLTDKYATIDLSKASDLLSLDLVKIVFGSKPSFLNEAIDCRSASVDTGKGILKLLKFAGMGNALTFPVQSVTFATVAICAILCQDGQKPTYGRAKRAAARIRVFGDDIIVETEYALQVVDWLTSFGLKVNQKKSFLKGNFKESCGVDAYKGYDVTPTYIRHEPVITAWNPEQIAHLVSASNQLWLKGLYSCANQLRDSVDRVISLPLVSKLSSALGWHCRVDTTVAHAWDRKLQQLVFRAKVIKPVYDQNDRLDGIAALLKTLTMMNNRDKGVTHQYFNEIDRLVDPLAVDEQHLERSVRKFKTRICTRWVPAKAG